MKRRWLWAWALSLALHASLFLLPSPTPAFSPLPALRLSFHALLTGNEGEGEKAGAADAGGIKNAPSRSESQLARLLQSPKKIQPKPPQKTPAKMEPKPKAKPAPEKQKTRMATDASSKTTPTQAVASGTAGSGFEKKGNLGEGAGDGSGPASPVGSPVDVFTLKILSKTTPEYPLFSRKRREEGTATLLISIRGGRVTEAKVERSSGYARLDEAALSAVKTWVFDCPGSLQARVPIAFRIR